MRLLAPIFSGFRLFSPGAGYANPAHGSKRVLKWLALGDSYTIGESVSESDRWPAQLADLLRAQGISTDLTMIARTGWTVDELWLGIQAASLDPPYDIVSLLIGVNNQYRGLGLDEYGQQFRFLLEKAISFAGDLPGKVLVLSIPDWGVTPFASGRDRAGIASAIDQFNAVNRDLSGISGVRYVDVTPESRRDAQIPGFIAEDGLHPSGKMYAEWAKLAFPEALKILQAP